MSKATLAALSMRSNFNDWFDLTANFTQNTNWYATARGRVGISNGPALFYFTGGAAWVNVEDGFAPTNAIATGDLAWHTRSGWTFGGGTEVALNERWSAKLESLFINTGTSAHTNVPPPGCRLQRRFQGAIRGRPRRPELQTHRLGRSALRIGGHQRQQNPGARRGFCLASGRAASPTASPPPSRAGAPCGRRVRSRSVLRRAR